MGTFEQTSRSRGRTFGAAWKNQQAGRPECRANGAAGDGRGSRRGPVPGD